MIEELLKKSSLKNTKQRHIILSVIESAKEPITAEEIFKTLVMDDHKINLSTVYRTLHVLTEKNVLLKILKGDGTASYELNELSHSHYITCSKCNNSILIENCPLKDLNESIGRKTGFKVTGHSLQFTGICAECLKKQRNKNKEE
ncbi:MULTISPECIES: Fur family transcriptional regulator [unclassified Sedimentibacter]|uniref:Fur family transcriptional regulator n=1 Tax=unclassified Sedimentibacter TaxID=2649220 RepID=UPI0027DF1C98|nr:Fur family transcriptional regulator [Sedimentibacter sp. MB35-C1]WMJ77920.1 Fur family transcriptional regulator [Sedimentibacter sp. MB35-C1]